MFGAFRIQLPKGRHRLNVYIVKEPPEDIGRFVKGRAYEVVPEIGAVLVTGRYAECIDAPVIETASVTPPENAAKRTYKPKPRTRKGPQ